MKRENRLIAAILALLFSFTLLLVQAGPALAEEPTTRVNRFNVVMVIDKSGSLRYANGKGTDPEGLRFDAIKLFLGLLTEGGNNVGAVVFDEQIRYDSGLRPMETMEDKKALIDAVESFGASYDTDIGGAVLRATEILHGMREQNGLPCVILLLTDGKTDFDQEYAWAKMRRSYASAQQALNAAQDEGMTIYGILLNVNNSATGGEIELQLYTEGTHGAFEQVNTPEDLSAAFKRFYSVINGTEYSGTQKISFSPEGAAGTEFIVPRFGLEEVNIVIEHESVKDIKQLSEITQVEITQPDGSIYDSSERELQSSRYMLIKIPDPMPGRWNVSLAGDPGDTVDICMIYNPTLTASLSADDPSDRFYITDAHSFRAEITDAEEQFITEDDLRSIEAWLVVHNLDTDEVKRYSMTAEGTGYNCEINFEKGGSYSVTAQVGLDDFAVRSNSLAFSVVVPPPVAKTGGISNMLYTGYFHDDLWEFDFSGLFEDPKGTELRYSLSDSLGGALSIDGEKLLARFRGVQSAAFSLIATDTYGLSAEIPFSLTVPAPYVKVAAVTEVPGDGVIRDGVWEISLDKLFDDPKGTELQYTLPNNLGGALTIDGKVLQARFKGMRTAYFTVQATDAFGLTAELPFELSIPTLLPKVTRVTDMLEFGTFRDDAWEITLSELFSTPDWVELSYAVSDDYDGAITLEGDVLRARFQEEDAVSFTLTASDGEGTSVDVPFELVIPEPAARFEEISDMFSLGHFEGNVWVLPLDEVFADPKGTSLRYSLSDNYNGALAIENGELRANLEGFKRAYFNVEATDAFGLQNDVYFELSSSLPTANVARVNNMLSSGHFHGEVWELPLDGLFADTNGTGLTYSLSDDFGGALRIVDNVLRLDYPSCKKADFTLKATDGYGLSTGLPFSLTVPGPSPRGSLSDTVKTGLFQEGTWEHTLDGLFTEPKGTAMRYSLSDDFNGAVRLEDGKIKVNCKGLGTSTFRVIATDIYDLTGELSVTLTEKNMTPLFLLIGLGIFLVLAAVIVLLIILRRRQTCNLKITVSRFGPETAEELLTVNGFRKRYSLKALGEVEGFKGEDFSFVVTGEFKNCVLQSKQPFYVNSRITKSRSAVIVAGGKTRVTSEPGGSTGLEITAEA